MGFRDVFKDLLIENNLSIYELSLKTGIKQSTLYGYQEDSDMLCLENAIKLSQFYGCTIDYLLGLTENNNFYPKRKLRNFGNFYLELLKKNRTTNYAICRKLGIGRNRVYDWLKGALPKLSTLIELSKCFEVSVEELVFIN